MNDKNRKEVTPQLLKYILQDDCSQEEKDATPIAAEEVVEAIKQGKKVEVINAVIDGPFTLRSTTIENEVTIKSTKFRETVDCSYSTFNQVVDFSESEFEADAIFTMAMVNKDIFLDGGTFKEGADFANLTVAGGFYSRDAVFKAKVDFNTAEIEGYAGFDRATFAGEANFIATRIGGQAGFTKAVFKAKANFNNAQIEGAAFFKQATFEGEADFGYARIGIAADFVEAMFKKNANFNVTHINGTGGFIQAVFEGEVDFQRVLIAGAAHFTKAVFKAKANFNSAQIEEDGFFALATFEGEADFGLVRVDGNMLFDGTVFAKDVKIEDASLRTLTFGKEGRIPFMASIDLRGCTYERIDPVDSWRELMGRLEPYDRQPFTQLEATFRRSGWNRMADDVYYERRCRESVQLTKGSPAWFLDRFLKGLTGYGVRLRRLILPVAIILLLGSCIFLVEGAVEPKIPNQLSSVVENKTEFRIPWSDAFWVSFNAFLPVEIPSVTPWQPSSQTWGLKFTTWATILSLAGWILVPVAVAGLSGLLKR